jgi:hypothetical protein
MPFWKRAKREQSARDAAKASALVEKYGDGAEDYVNDRIAASAWEIRTQDRWRRIAKHVNKLQRR